MHPILLFKVKELLVLLMAMVTITVLQLLVMIMITAPPNLGHGQQVRMTAHITLQSPQVVTGNSRYLHVFTCTYIHLHTFTYIYIYLHIFTCIYRYLPVILGIYRYLLGGGGRVDSSVLPSTGQT